MQKEVSGSLKSDLEVTGSKPSREGVGGVSGWEVAVHIHNGVLFSH